jgi:hypothetical protein
MPWHQLGATTIMLIHRDGDYVRLAGKLAERLVEHNRTLGA